MDPGTKCVCVCCIQPNFDYVLILETFNVFWCGEGMTWNRTNSDAPNRCTQRGNHLMNIRAVYSCMASLVINIWWPLPTTSSVSLVFVTIQWLWWWWWWWWSCLCEWIVLPDSPVDDLKQKKKNKKSFFQQKEHTIKEHHWHKMQHTNATRQWDQPLSINWCTNGHYN